MIGQVVVEHVELVNVQGLENAITIHRVGIKIIHARQIFLKGRLVTRRNVLSLRNGPIGLRVPQHVVEEIKREQEFVLNPYEQYFLIRLKAIF